MNLPKYTGAEDDVPVDSGRVSSKRKRATLPGPNRSHQRYLEVLVKCMVDPLYDVTLGNIKGVVLPDAIPLDYDTRRKTETKPTTDCDKEKPAKECGDVAASQENTAVGESENVAKEDVAIAESASVGDAAGVTVEIRTGEFK
ncbi:hypothetical protein HPB52_024719 [Rhipicephalus sanguineus]|uniref:Uncharacterized protein n=1 Tax=Rhipicephalus sanguineus TaxID=34632 RepID=A0A9D4TDZ8_RHISA|nr:hypothetical protein HPB52_024719 [Rhipicephalus sanguineus]